MKNLSFAEFLDAWKFDKMMEQNPYSVQKDLFDQLKQKVKYLGLVNHSEEFAQNKGGATKYMNYQELVKLR
jgi:hypothetical protein